MISKLPHTCYDVICASDVLLFRSGHEDLINTLGAISNQNTVILIEHTDRLSEDGLEYPVDLVAFLKVIETDGLWKPLIIRDQGRYITLRMVRNMPNEIPFSFKKFPPRLVQ